MGWVLAYGIVNAMYPIVTKLVMPERKKTDIPSKDAIGAPSHMYLARRHASSSAKMHATECVPRVCRFPGHQRQVHDDMGAYVLQQHHDVHRFPPAGLCHGGGQDHVGVPRRWQTDHRRDPAAVGVMHLGDCHLLPWLSFVSECPVPAPPLF